MRRYGKKLVSVLACFLLLTSCGTEEVVEEETVSSTPVEVSTVSWGDIATTNTVSGSISPMDTETVILAVSAKCKAVYVSLGDEVVAGEALCNLDLTAVWDSYELTKLAYDNAVQTRLDQENILSQQIKQAEDNYYNTLALFEIGAASQIEVDSAKITMDTAVASQTSALTQLDMAVTNAKISYDQMADTVDNLNANGDVLAPISGVVSMLNVVENSYAAQGAVAAVSSLEKMEVVLSVSESLATKISVGDLAKVEISSLGTSFYGEVTQASRVANAMTRMYDVVVSVPDDVEGLLGGMFAQVTLYSDTRENTLLIPSQAISLTTEGQYVVILDEENLAHHVFVETGLIGDGVTEVLSGLVGGETLVVVGQSYLAEGDLARIVSSEV